MKTNLPPPHRNFRGFLLAVLIFLMADQALAEQMPVQAAAPLSGAAHTPGSPGSTTPDPIPNRSALPEANGKDATTKKEGEPESLDGESPSSETSEPEEPEPISYPRIRPSGQIQFQVDDGSLGAPRANSPFPSSSGIGPFPADARIFVRRFRPTFDVEFNPDLNLKTEFNIDPHSERIQILDFRFDQNLSDETFVSVGRYKVPFGWEGLRSSRATNTIERSDMTVSLYPERDVGISLNHETGLGEFSLGSFLGQPRSNGAANGHLDVIGRGLFNVHENVKVGVSGHIGSYRPSGTSLDIPVRRVGTELHVEKGPVTLEAEAMWSDGYNTMTRGDTKAFGYYAAVVTQLAPR